MKKYVVSVISAKSGSHEVHIDHCTHLPRYVNVLGEYESYLKAKLAIGKILPQVHPCPYCIRQIKN